jgi:hypothetical protein
MAWISVQASANLGGMVQWNRDHVCVDCQHGRPWGLWSSRAEVIQACTDLRVWPGRDRE